MGSVDGLSGRRPLSCDECRRLILKRAVRSQEVVVLLPPRQLLPHILEREEYLDVQALVPEPSVEALDETILHGFPRSNNIQLDPMTIGPGIHDATGEFAPVVHGDRTWGATLEHQGFQGCGHLLPCERLIGDQTQAFPRELVHDGQDPKPSAIGDPCTHAVHAPPLVRRCGHGLRYPVPSGGLHSHRGPSRQPFFRVEPRDAFGIHGPAVPSQQHREAAIPEPYAGRGHLAKTPPSGHLRIPMALVSQGGACQWHPPRHPALTDLIRRVRPADQRPPVSRPYSLFRTISCSMCRSSERSATSRFSLVCSSRTC